MSIHLRFKLAGIALTLGGLTAATCHLFGFEASAEVSYLAKYASFAEPVHLLLCASLLMVLLACSELYSLSSPSGKMCAATFVCLFLGIICGDLLQCTLEFSVFPVLGSMVPYALPGIADATYRSTALGKLIWAGQALMFLGAVASATSTRRGRLLPPWAAGPFAVSAVLLGLGLFPLLSAVIRPASLPAFYIAIAVMGVSVFRPRKARKEKSFRAESGNEMKPV
jgi:hypothetical protein